MLQATGDHSGTIRMWLVATQVQFVCDWPPVFVNCKQMQLLRDRLEIYFHTKFDMIKDQAAEIIAESQSMQIDCCFLIRPNFNSISLYNCIQAKTIEFDINFLNFEDPDVLERLTGPDFEKHWKSTYGVDFATVTAPDFTTGKFHEHCLKAEFR